MFFIYTPSVSCIALLSTGLFYFILACSVDYIKYNNFQGIDGAIPKMFPRTLAPDRDVIAEKIALEQEENDQNYLI